MKKNIEAYLDKTVVLGSKHSHNHPRKAMQQTRNLNRVCAYVAPTFAHIEGTRVHTSLMASIAAYFTGEAAHMENVTPSGRQRVDVLTSTTIFEMKKDPSLFQIGAAIAQADRYRMEHKTKNCTVVAPMKEQGILRFEAYGQSFTRELAVDMAAKWNVNLIFAPSSSINMTIDEDGYVSAFAFAKEYGVNILRVIHEAETGALDYKARKYKKEALMISLASAIAIFGLVAKDAHAAVLAAIQ